MTNERYMSALATKWSLEQVSYLLIATLRFGIPSLREVSKSIYEAIRFGAGRDVAHSGLRYTCGTANSE